MQPPLASFHTATQDWFRASFAEPTRAQLGAWESIAAGAHSLVIAPTGSGKTLAAFLWAIDRLLHADPPPDGVSVLYVSPLKALAVDVERNLRTPLAGIRQQAERAGAAVQPLRIGIRSGDTPAAERRRLTVRPPHILITTPESLYLMLTSRAREALRTVETVIIDEVHAVAPTKRGSHLAASLERLDHLLGRSAQRIGLSATVEPPNEIATFLGGDRRVEIVDARQDKQVEITIEVPVEDLTELRSQDTKASDGTPAKPIPSIWPHVEARVLDLVRSHRSTIIFANSRRLAERFCGQLNELAGHEIARTHHGSVSHERRASIEHALKSGELAAVVATSSLELGIDMGAVDLVVQIEAPSSVATGLQRIGRAGHQVGAASRGIVFPKYRGDLLEAAVVAQRMAQGAIESMRFPRNPLDVLAQQIVAMVTMDEWPVDQLLATLRRAAPFAALERPTLDLVLDMLAGRYPSDAFSGLRPRLTWDRVTDRLTPRSGSHSIAVTSGGTIPDRGLFGVFLSGAQRTRVGELDEEMVYESRVGEVFVLGATSWRIEEIGKDRVLVSPAPGQPGRMPFWHGEAPGRPIELGRAIGEFVRELSELDDDQRHQRILATGCDALAAKNLNRYLEDQRSATELLPDDHTIVVERFRDAIGDWRVCIHTFFGARVHAPWSQVIRARLREKHDLDAQVIYSDDGIVVRLPDGDELPGREAFFPEHSEIEDLVIAELGNSALFASRFREAAARALLLPRPRPGGRTPLWLQRQKASTLLQIAATHDSFPIVLETYRECLQDIFDLPALLDLVARIERREISVTEVDTASPSPFASSLQLAYVGAFMYDGDAPLAERRAQALALDRSVLAELLGAEELRDLLDPTSLVDVEQHLQWLRDDRRARHADDLHDLLRQLGAMDRSSLEQRSQSPQNLAAWLEELATSHRALAIETSTGSRWIAIEDAALYRDGLAVALPDTVPAQLLEEVEDPLAKLVTRFARCHGPFTERELALHLGVGVGVVRETLRRLEGDGSIAGGGFRPGGRGREWIDPEVLRRLRRRSLAALRKEIEPAPQEALVRFATAWQGVGPDQRRWAGIDGLHGVIAQLQGLPLAASLVEQQILGARLQTYSPAELDQLGATGELLWSGCGQLGNDDGWIVLARAQDAATLLPAPPDAEPSALALRVLEALVQRGAMFFRQLSDAVDGPNDDALLAALWELVWTSRVTNDTLAPLRAYLRGRATPKKRRRSAAPRGPQRVGPPSGAGRWSVLPAAHGTATHRFHAAAEQALQRHGIVTRGTATGERSEGGFAALYAIFRAFEDRGVCRRGYFVEGLGGAQFALPAAVDRMRALAEDTSRTAPGALVLAATDPANPFGATIPWPERNDLGSARAGRKIGAVVVLVGGRLILYLERGGRTALTYSTDEDGLRSAAQALISARQSAFLDAGELQTVDGEPVRRTKVGAFLEQAGAQRSVKGLEI